MQAHGNFKESDESFFAGGSYREGAATQTFPKSKNATVRGWSHRRRVVPAPTACPYCLQPHGCSLGLLMLESRRCLLLILLALLLRVFLLAGLRLLLLLWLAGSLFQDWLCCGKNLGGCCHLFVEVFSQKLGDVLHVQSLCHGNRRGVAGDFIVLSS